MNNETILTINEHRLAELLEAERELLHLHSAGVDNWAGYEDAMEELRDE